MARQTQAAELRPVNSATLEPLAAVAVSPPEEVAEAVAEARLAGERCAQGSFGAVWEHRRGLLRLGRRYLSGS
jgi:hypothetical protein